MLEITERALLEQIFAKAQSKAQQRRLKQFFNHDLHNTEIPSQDVAFFAKLCIEQQTISQRDSIEGLQPLFAPFSEIEFTRCHFALPIETLFAPTLACRFIDCTFNAACQITEHPLLGGAPMFSHCLFRQQVSVSATTAPANDAPAFFHDCQFDQTLRLTGTLTRPVFANLDLIKNEQLGFYFGKIHQLEIHYATLKSHFVLTRVKLDKLAISHSQFDAEFELKDCAINKLSVVDVRMEKTAELFNCHLEHFRCQKCKFADFTSFEKCSISQFMAFKYVTFLSFTSFRKANFKQGLDLTHCNFKEAPNFVNVELSGKQTNRETFRIIKHAFSKAGNVIEEEKYAVLEMRQYRQELKASGRTFSQENVILFFNQKISNFGSSYKRSFVWLMLSVLVFTLIEVADEVNFASQHWPSAITIMDYFDAWVLGTFPFFARFLPKGIEFIGLFYYFFFSCFLWQFITSVKRHSKMK